MSEPTQFYVGYGRVPTAMQRWLRVVIPGLLVIAGVSLGTFAASQHPFTDSTFEFGNTTQLSGYYVADPHPALMVSSAPPQATGTPSLSRVHLVGSGKFAAAIPANPGEFLTVSGTLIERAQQTMLEVIADSVQLATPATKAALTASVALGAAELSGEIVDSKCHLGVMKPGDGTAHRACAIRCISGGLPPMLVTRNKTGQTDYVLLSDDQRNVIGAWLLPYVGKPVRVRGTLETRNGATYLNTAETGVTLL
ncbi:MAG: hypothetical protein AAFO81_12595 [Pseudomonadota bacterium]